MFFFFSCEFDKMLVNTTKFSNQSQIAIKDSLEVDITLPVHLLLPRLFINYGSCNCACELGCS